MEGGGPHPDHRRGDKEHGEAAGRRQQTDPDQGGEHPAGQQIGLGMLVRIEADPGLKQRRRELVDQGDKADLGEAQGELRLQHRIDGRQDRLNQIVEEVGEGHGADDPDKKTRRGRCTRDRLGVCQVCRDGHGLPGAGEQNDQKMKPTPGACLEFSCAAGSLQILATFSLILLTRRMTRNLRSCIAPSVERPKQSSYGLGRLIRSPASSR